MAVVAYIFSVSEMLEIFESFGINFNSRGYSGPGQTNATSDYIYRGIKNASYKLKPRAVNLDLCRPRFECYDEPLEVFQKESSGYLYNVCGSNKLLWMEYAQHFGVPTRLLDFSTNPLVSLYFACEDTTVDGALWIIYMPYYEHFTVSSYIETHGKSIPVDKSYLDIVIDSEVNDDLMPACLIPEYIDNRMLAQSSRFLLWPNNDFALDDVFTDDYFMQPCTTKSLNNIERFVLKAVIPRDCKTRILRELDIFGINEKSLFPGLDSIGRYVNQLFNPHYQDD